MYSSSLKPQEFSSFSLVRTHSIRCTSDCTMEQIISCWRPSWSYYQPPPHVSIFFWKCDFFLRFSKLIRSHAAFLNRFRASRSVRFRLKTQKFFPFLIIYPSTRTVFDTVTSSFSKSSVLKSLHENKKNSAFNVKSSHAKSSWFLYSTQAGWGGGGGRDEVWDR